MSETPKWHGTQDEAMALLEVLRENCTCAKEGPIIGRCQVHQMLARDQRALDGLLFGRRMADRFRDREFNVPKRK